VRNPRVATFRDRHRHRRDTHLDNGSADIWASYEIYAQPAYAFITDDGRVETYIGSLGGDGLADIIEKLIVA